MRFSRFAHFVKLTTLLLCSSSAMFAQNGIWGEWKEPTGSVIEVFHCGNDACLRLIAISSTAPTKTDDHNPDTQLRSRPLCGLQIGSGFHPEGGDAADGGSLYDPKSGKTYKGSMMRQSEELHLRGYIGVKLFGRTETWVRATNVSSCMKNP